jgi:hypothetical protein
MVTKPGNSNCHPLVCTTHLASGPPSYQTSAHRRRRELRHEGKAWRIPCGELCPPGGAERPEDDRFQRQRGGCELVFGLSDFVIRQP